MNKMIYMPNEKFLDNTISQSQMGIFIDPTADIHPNAYFEGKVTIGPYSQIEAGVVIKGNVSIGSHSTVRCNVSLRGTIAIGNNVHIFDQVNIEGGRPGDYLATSSCAIPDKAIVADGCIVGPGTTMHGTQLGEGTVIGMRCNCDYNTRIGKGVVLANGTATNVDQVIPDYCIADGVPSIIVKSDIKDEDRQKYLGYVPSDWTRVAAFKLEERAKANRRIADRKTDTMLDLDPTANIHPTAILEGNVKIGAYTQVGAGSILVGDIKIGDYTNITLNTVIKGAVTIGNTTHIYDNVLIDGSRKPDIEVQMRKSLESIDIGNSCWLNHACAIRGCDVEDAGAVAISAVCDYNSRIGKGAILANLSAAAIDQYIPENCFAEGVPAVVKNRDISDEDRRDYFGLIPAEWAESRKVKFENIIKKKQNLMLDEMCFVHPKAWLEGNISVGPFTYIDAGTIISGDVTIGHHTLLRCNVSVRGKISIGDYTHIYDQVNIESGRPGNYDGSSTCAVPDEAVIGSGCWINHGCTMHGTRVDDGGAVNIGACCDYNTHVCKGAIIGNHSSTNVNQIVSSNCMVVGVPSVVTKRFLTESDRHSYFGLKPSGWTQAEGKWNEDLIRSMKK